MIQAEVVLRRSSTQSKERDCKGRHWLWVFDEMDDVLGDNSAYTLESVVNVNDSRVPPKSNKV